MEFVLGAGQVIRGWEEGVARMGVGERAWLAISPGHGYGERGYADARGEHIPPGAELLFDVELLSIDGERPARAARPPPPPPLSEQQLDDSWLPAGFGAEGKKKARVGASGGGAGAGAADKKKKKKGKGKKKK